MGTKRLHEVARQAAQSAYHILTTDAKKLEDQFAGWYQFSGKIAVACDEAGCMPVYFAGKH